MSLRSNTGPVFQDESDIFGIIYNHRKLEKAKRRKLLRRFKLLKLLKKRNLKSAYQMLEKEPQKELSIMNQDFLWDVLEKDCVDFKLDHFFDNQEESLSFQINKTSEATHQFNKQEVKKTLFVNVFSEFKYQQL